MRKNQTMKFMAVLEYYKNQNAKQVIAVSKNIFLEIKSV